MLKIWSGKYEGITSPSGWIPSNYNANRFLGINKANKDVVPAVKRSLLLQNLANVVSSYEQGIRYPLIFETEMIVTPEFNLQRAMVDNICRAALGGLELVWGTFDQMNSTHSLSAFLDPLNRNRRTVFERAAALQRIGDYTFTPFYLRRSWIEGMDPIQWRQAIRGKIECCSQSYAGTILTLCPYYAELREAMEVLRNTTGEPNPNIPMETLVKYRIPMDYLSEGIEECCEYGAGVNIWTFPSLPDDEVLKAIEG